MRNRRTTTSALIALAVLTATASPLPAAAAPACPTGVAGAMTKVNDYWLAHNTHPTGLDWTTGAYFTGDMAAARALNSQQYQSYAATWANGVHYALKGGQSDTNANDQAVGQTYIELYQQNPSQSGDITQINQSVTSMVNSSKVDDWYWIDALFMAMPDFAKLGVLTNTPADFTKMYAEFQHTQQGLFDPNKGLWWRDSSFAGKNIYWSRGNGWVAAALARVLDVLPANDPHRATYVQTLQSMAAALRAAQQPSGFWYVNLGDPTQYPGPETSGTAFFTYALTWGINNGILDAATYGPVVTKAWNAMASTSVRSNGALGYVQGTGTSPSSAQPVTANSTGSYGVGAFLLAGSELIKMGCTADQAG
ncbi:MAG TPA: glycoside hydrolase family 88 protein [Pseudonocardiaceae bacterium]|jgi:rhamnogalacturonyl hydrolase YesR|nr:glycoside hydrolase family 88 protein [Pseudonocardiaceae bacterium]